MSPAVRELIDLVGRLQRRVSELEKREQDRRDFWAVVWFSLAAVVVGCLVVVGLAALLYFALMGSLS